MHGCDLLTILDWLMVDTLCNLCIGISSCRQLGTQKGAMKHELCQGCIPFGRHICFRYNCPVHSCLPILYPFFPLACGICLPETSSLPKTFSLPETSAGSDSGHTNSGLKQQFGTLVLHLHVTVVIVLRYKMRYMHMLSWCVGCGFMCSQAQICPLVQLICWWFFSGATIPYTISWWSSCFWFPLAILQQSFISCVWAYGFAVDWQRPISRTIWLKVTPCNLI